MNALGKRIKSLRKSKGLNQVEFSKALNLQFNLKTDRVMVSKWETGFQEPIMSTVVCIAKYFGVSVEYLNGETSIADIDQIKPLPQKADGITITEENEKQLITDFRKLNNSGQSAANAMVNGLTTQDIYKKTEDNKAQLA